MQRRPARHMGSPIRYGAAIAAAALAGIALTGCGDDATKSAGWADRGIYVNGSSAEEYCSVLENTKASLQASIEAENDAVLLAIHTIKDIEPLAPEENKADWAGMKLIMQAAVDAHGAETIGALSRAEAGAMLTDLSGRVSESVSEICGFSLG